MVTNEPVAAPVRLRRSPRQREREFADFYRAEVTPLVRFVMKIGATEHEAADAAQAALVEIWLSWASIHTSPRAWVRRVATRKFLLSRDSRVTPVDAMPDIPELLSPEAVLLVSERTRAALDMLNQLPPLQREVLAWAADGFTTAEIARQTDCRTEAAVRKNLQRARATLRALLGEREERNS